MGHALRGLECARLKRKPNAILWHRAIVQESTGQNSGSFQTTQYCLGADTLWWYPQCNDPVTQGLRLVGKDGCYISSYTISLLCGNTYVHKYRYLLINSRSLYSKRQVLILTSYADLKQTSHIKSYGQAAPWCKVQH